VIFPVRDISPSLPPFIPMSPALHKEQNTEAAASSRDRKQKKWHRLSLLLHDDDDYQLGWPWHVTIDIGISSSYSTPTSTTTAHTCNLSWCVGVVVYWTTIVQYCIIDIRSCTSAVRVDLYQIHSN
jgi:hypothetical protein